MVINMFCDLSDPQIRDIHHRMHTLIIEAGTIFYRPNEIADKLFSQEWSSRDLSDVPGRKRYVLSTATQGNIFGEMALVGRSVNTAFAVAVERSTTRTMTRSRINDMIDKHRLVGLRIMQTLANRVNEVEAHLEPLALKSLSARLASLLLDLAPQQAVVIVGLTHKDLA